MSFNVCTFLQLAVFVAIVFNVNLHPVSAESNGQSSSSSSGKSMKVDFCETNCTEKDGVWSECTGECFCVHVGDSKEGRCMHVIN
ncbi:evasin P1124-like [Ixodes scapularis]|uniref:evasin P1124-like n=1 Tax=Ixodes scapularis TaxID=6945 RepID=UPI001A9F5414|nr:evasin P1124-like [Ixodes scapularis]